MAPSFGKAWNPHATMEICSLPLGLLSTMGNYLYTDQLQTERLTTRFLTPEDAVIWSQFFADPQAVELFPPQWLGDPISAARNWVERQLGRYADQRYGMQALIHRQTGEFIGQCGLLAQEVDGVQELEVGYHVLHRYWGQGFAPEAARRFIKYGFDNKLADSIISIIDVRNHRSQRVAEKNRLFREKQTRWNDLDVFVYRIKQDSLAG